MIAPAIARRAPPDEGMESVHFSGIYTSFAVCADRAERRPHALGVIAEVVVASDRQEERRERPRGALASLEHHKRIGEIDAALSSAREVAVGDLGVSIMEEPTEAMFSLEPVSV